ncbi:MAG: reverse transcriptase domain-containing protein [Bacteroidota bacterium]
MDAGERANDLPTGQHAPDTQELDSFLFGNIDGLLSRSGRIAKIPILEEDSRQNNYLFMALTESHLNDTSLEAEYNISGYSHILGNRIGRQGGGVILYINNNLSYEVINYASDDMCSLLAVTIRELKLTIILIYRPPGSSKPGSKYNGQALLDSFDNIILRNIENSIRSLGTPTPNVLVMGDFNFRQITWNGGIATPTNGHSTEAKMINHLIRVCETHQLLQTVPFGTRSTNTGRENKLDLIFSNNDQLLSDLRKLHTALSDHSLIECDLSFHFSHPNYNPNTPSEEIEDDLSVFNINKADWKEIRNFLRNKQWRVQLLNKTNEEKRRIIVSTVYEALNKFCPKYKNKRGQTKNKIPRDRRILFRQRKRKKSSLKTVKANSQKAQRIHTEITRIERDIMSSLHNEHMQEEEKAIENIKENSKYFFTYARKRRNAKRDIGPLKVDGNLLVAPEQICEALSAQYSSAYSPRDPNNIIDDPTSFFNLDRPDLPSLQDIEFSEDKIEEEIGTLRNNSAAGPDRFPALILKKCKKELKKPLYILWRSSLSDCDIAQIFKHAITCPVLKSCSQSFLPKSYRPVSLTSHLIKVFEKIIAKEILQYLIKNKLVPWNQHGFLNDRSTMSQLLSQTEIILRYLEAGDCADTIYLDFAKAFDKVDHFILCKKLKEKRIGGKVGAWLHNFLTNRTLQVSANGALSSPAPVLSGVPQGTVLGPILFIIMISDIDENLNQAFMSLFADDSRVTRRISSDNENNEDCILLQEELDNVIYPWASRNNAVFNGDKFEYVRFGSQEEPWQYKDNIGNPISCQTNVKDLGVTITSDLSWSTHIENTVTKCRNMSAWILRTFTKRDITTMRTLWISLLRPLVDYCSPVWSPKPKSYGLIDQLEGILRGFSKHVDGLADLPYCARLKALNLQSIQRRHERYKIIYLYKMKEKLVPCLPNDPMQPENSFALQFHHTRRKGIRCKLPSPTLHHNGAHLARESSFAQTATNLWNRLPRCITLITGEKVDTFKKKLDKFLDIIPDEPRCNASGLYRDDALRVTNSIVHIIDTKTFKNEIAVFNRFQEQLSAQSGEGLDEVIPHP